jgi:hypothetical protein
MGSQILSFQVTALLKCCNLTPGEHNSGRTHIARPYVKLPTVQWWRILILLKWRTQTEHQKCTRWRWSQSSSNCNTYYAEYCLSSTAVSITLFTLTSLHSYIWQVSELASQPSYTAGKAVKLEGDCDSRHLVHFWCSVCVRNFNNNSMRHHCTVGNLTYSRAMCVRPLLCSPGVKFQHFRRAVTWKLSFWEPMFVWIYITVFGCTTHH